MQMSRQKATMTTAMETVRGARIFRILIIFLTISESMRVIFAAVGLFRHSERRAPMKRMYLYRGCR